MNEKGPAAQPTEPATTEKSKNPSRAALSRHKRKCTICQHPQRDQIEQEFLQWRSPRTIAAFYKLTERAVYRHAHARRLFERRGNNLRFSLYHILEQAEHVPATPNSIIEAVRVFAHITDDGRWVNPPRHVIIEHVGEDEPGSPFAAQTPPARQQKSVPNQTGAPATTSRGVVPGVSIAPKGRKNVAHRDTCAAVAQCSERWVPSGAERHTARGDLSASSPIPPQHNAAKASRSTASNRQSPPSKSSCNSLKTNDRIAV